MIYAPPLEALSGLARRALRAAPNADHLDLFQCHEAGTDHGIELRQERFDLFFEIDDLDDRGEITRRIDVGFVVDPVAMAEAQRPIEDGAPASFALNAASTMAR